jgi:hypothetical protein
MNRQSQVALYPMRQERLKPGGRDPRPYAVGADNDNRLTGTRG